MGLAAPSADPGVAGREETGLRPRGSDATGLERAERDAVAVNAGEAGVRLGWVSHPFRRQRTKGALTLLLIAGVVVLTGFMMRSFFWGAFAGLVLVLSLEGFYFPTRFELLPGEVEVRRVFSRSRSGWGAIRRVYEDRHGLTLSPFRRRSILEPYRAIRLLYDGGDRDAIIRLVRERCPGADWIGPDAGGRRRKSLAGQTGRSDSTGNDSGRETSGCE